MALYKFYFIDWLIDWNDSYSRYYGMKINSYLVTLVSTKELVTPHVWTLPGLSGSGGYCKEGQGSKRFKTVEITIYNVTCGFCICTCLSVIKSRHNMSHVSWQESRHMVTTITRVTQHYWYLQWMSCDMLPLSADPLLQQCKATLKSNNNFCRSVGKASKVDDSQEENGITQYNTHEHGPLQTACFHQQLEQISKRSIHICTETFLL